MDRHPDETHRVYVTPARGMTAVWEKIVVDFEESMEVANDSYLVIEISAKFNGVTNDSAVIVLDNIVLEETGESKVILNSDRTNRVTRTRIYYKKV